MRFYESQMALLFHGVPRGRCDRRACRSGEGSSIGSGSIGSGVRTQSRSDDKARCERTSESPAPVRDSRESEVPQTEEVDLEVII